MNLVSFETNRVAGRGINVPHGVLFPIGALEERAVVLAQTVHIVRGQERGNLQQLIGEDEPADVHGVKAEEYFMNAHCGLCIMHIRDALPHMTAPSLLMTANPKFSAESIILYLSLSLPPNSRFISGAVSGRYGTSNRFASASEICRKVSI